MKQVIENKNIAFVKESDESYKSIQMEEDFYIQETSEQEGTELMADIDAFKNIFHKIARQVALH